MQRLPAAIFGLAIACAAARAQDDYTKFRAKVEQDLKQHPFFTKIVFTLVDRPPFLFCIERSSNDEKDWEIGIVNSYLPFLRELSAQFEEDYQKPCELVRRPEAGGYAMAILSSGGRYLDFRTAIGDPSLAMARAHYTPSLRLAVTYVDTFARYNANHEERHAVLHEFVHALQHAHAKDGQMPKPAWFNEGLADYRSSCTNVATSLREPQQQLHHLRGLAFGYGNPAGRFYIAPIADLVAADSYKDVLELAKKRNGMALKTEAVMGIFYSQAEMFVRFLHEGEKRKHEAGFLRYVRAAQNGESGLAVFQKALGLTTPDAMAKLEAEWLVWLDAALRVQYPGLRDLTKGAGKGGGAAPMAPPIAFDTTGLRWTAEDLTERLAGVRRLCARGEYEAAQALLPDDAEPVPPAEKEFIVRERARIGALVKLRDDALADLVQKGGDLSVTSGGNKLKGKVLKCSAEAIVLRIGTTETEVPLCVMTPAVLVGQGNRLDRFSKERWLEIWTRWLKGDTLASLQGLLKLDQKAIVELKRDLPRDLGASGMQAAAITELMRIPQVDDAKKARESLAWLQSLLRDNGKSPLLVRRKEAIDKLARALAERAFRVDDLAALGVRGAVAETGQGAFRIEYKDSGSAPNADFSPLSKEEIESLFAGPSKIAHSGDSGLLPAQGGWRLVGSTALRWSVALRGKQTVEMEFSVHADFVPDCGIAMCLAEGRMLLVTLTGGVQVLDPEQNVVEPIGGGAMLVVGEKHRLRLEHDGAKVLRVSIDGKQTALVSDVGRLTAGEVVLFVHSTTPLEVSRLSISGVPSPLDPQQNRDRYVAGVIEKLWQ
ncbi:MAG TPA: hypothetical protein VF384_08650 [Planctomycetota bacterium]